MNKGQTRTNETKNKEINDHIEGLAPKKNVI